MNFTSPKFSLSLIIFLLMISLGCNQAQVVKKPEDLSTGRFIKTDSGGIYDKKTDMEWFIGPDKDMDWYEAVIWIYKMRNSEHKWRMPTQRELSFLYKSVKNDSEGSRLLQNENYQSLWTGTFPGCNNDFFPAYVMFYGDGGWSKSNAYNSSNKRVYAVVEYSYEKY